MLAPFLICWLAPYLSLSAKEKGRRMKALPIRFSREGQEDTGEEEVGDGYRVMRV
jgi:hypothetical protein